MNTYVIEIQGLSLEDRLNLVRIVKANGGEIYKNSKILSNSLNSRPSYFCLDAAAEFWGTTPSLKKGYTSISYQDFIAKFDKPKFNIDPTKIKPGMIIHTPTLEQMKAVCAWTTDKLTPDQEIFDTYGNYTCIEIETEDHWTYIDTPYCKMKGDIITPFEDILVQEPIPVYLDRKPRVGDYIGIITDQGNTYVGYVYADTIKQLKEIIAKSENEGNTIHCFKFQDSFKQATRPVVKVTRATTEVVEESNVPR